MSETRCPFCPPPAERIFYEGEKIYAFWDGFPVNEGHALIVPKRHVALWFDADPDEQSEILAGLQIVRKEILARHNPDGFNIGINVGAAAGQTVFHLHMHVIPRYRGDVGDPRGGVRGVVPGRQKYGGDEDNASAGQDSEISESGPVYEAPRDFRIVTIPHERPLIVGGNDAFLSHLLPQLDATDALDIAVAFIMGSGMRILEEPLKCLLERGGRLRILAGDYREATEPEALFRLLDLANHVPRSETLHGKKADPRKPADSLELRVYECSRSSFHPKAYILRMREGNGVAYVGSSNLSKTALTNGIEWNYRVLTSRDQDGFDEVSSSFENLFYSPSTQALTEEWIQNYAAMRDAISFTRSGPVGEELTTCSMVDEIVLEVPNETANEVPTPHQIQAEALEALQAARKDGQSAGLVVLGTGLGKTWLAAFDSEQAKARRVLFVAHREEILRQAMSTFRNIRPRARIGLFTGQEKDRDADILFASIQTLSRSTHLSSFARDHFDYVVVDEFHHAEAQSYRRLIDYFNPDFVLGLTATPERSDGGNVLRLCNENLIYRCDFPEGIHRGHLAPFHYFGVPDEIDYSNIPWRRTGFDEEALSTALEVTSRAQNALDQYRQRGGTRCLAFCCSQSHARFMRGYFREAGLRSAAVYAGDDSDPRSSSLEALRNGTLDVLFAVDMFNEGVDLPDVDTVLMLRPTESRIIWLQQFGRGLRRREGKTLKVIDYIGNHRSFLNKPKALLGLSDNPSELHDAISLIANGGPLQLPPGCEVTYDLESIEILKQLEREQHPKSRLATILSYYDNFADMHGRRPSASEALHDGYNPRQPELRRKYGSWLGLADNKGQLEDDEKRVLREGRIADFLDHLNSTSMTGSFKMLVLKAMLSTGMFPGSISVEALIEEVRRQAKSNPLIRDDFNCDIDDGESMRSYLEKNPLKYWCKGKFFRYRDGVFSTTFDVAEELQEATARLTMELAEWRLAAYLINLSQRSSKGFYCRIRHNGREPIVLLPPRKKVKGIPQGWRNVTVDGETLRANFVKIAVDVIKREDSDENVLPSILKKWFGADAGKAGTTSQVFFVPQADGFILRPAARGVDSGVDP